MKAYLPTVLQPGRTFETLNYQGKPALLRKLRDRLQGYARWLPNSHRIIILVDRDNDDCQPLKCQLECTCQRARLRTKSQGGDWQVAIRIVTEELEAWYSVTGKQCEPHTQTWPATFLVATGSLTRSRAVLGKPLNESCRNRVISAAGSRKRLRSRPSPRTSTPLAAVPQVSAAS